MLFICVDLYTLVHPNPSDRSSNSTDWAFKFNRQFKRLNVKVKQFVSISSDWLVKLIRLRVTVYILKAKFKRLVFKTQAVELQNQPVELPIQPKTPTFELPIEIQTQATNPTDWIFDWLSKPSPNSIDWLWAWAWKPIENSTGWACACYHTTYVYVCRYIYIYIYTYTVVCIRIMETHIRVVTMSISAFGSETHHRSDRAAGAISIEAASPGFL